MNKKSVSLGITFTLMGTAQVMAQVANILNEQQAEITSIGQIIVNIILGIFGAVALVQAIMIFIGPGDGQEKIKKAGTYIFMLVFIAVAYYLSTKLFN